MPETPTLNLEWRRRLEPVYRLYAAMASLADPEIGLGGKLLYAGELHQDGCQLVRAANIAGAASLSATANPEALRHANRDGVVDFLVTSLDEALRILKNEIRKRQAVSVAVSAAPDAIVGEIRERGVLPDLLPPAEWLGPDANLAEFVSHGARRVDTIPSPGSRAFTVWTSPSHDFEAGATTVLGENDHVNRRWLRLSPRYLGPAARRIRSLACTADEAARIEELLAAPPSI